MTTLNTEAVTAIAKRLVATYGVPAEAAIEKAMDMVEASTPPPPAESAPRRHYERGQAMQALRCMYQGYNTVEDIAKQTNHAPAQVQATMWQLASRGLVTQERERYRLTPEGSHAASFAMANPTAKTMTTAALQYWKDESAKMKAQMTLPRQPPMPLSHQIAQLGQSQGSAQSVEQLWGYNGAAKSQEAR